MYTMIYLIYMRRDQWLGFSMASMNLSAMAGPMPGYMELMPMFFACAEVMTVRYLIMWLLTRSVFESLPST